MGYTFIFCFSWKSDKIGSKIKRNRGLTKSVHHCIGIKQTFCKWVCYFAWINVLYFSFFASFNYQFFCFLNELILMQLYPHSFHIHSRSGTPLLSLQNRSPSPKRLEPVTTKFVSPHTSRFASGPGRARIVCNRSRRRRSARTIISVLDAMTLHKTCCVCSL